MIRSGSEASRHVSKWDPDSVIARLGNPVLLEPRSHYDLACYFAACALTATDSPTKEKHLAEAKKYLEYALSSRDPLLRAAAQGDPSFTRLCEDPKSKPDLCKLIEPPTAPEVDAGDALHEVLHDLKALLKALP